MNFEQRLKLATNFCLTDKSTIQFVVERLVPELEQFNADSITFNSTLREINLDTLDAVDVSKGRIALRIVNSRLRLVHPKLLPKKEKS